MIPDTSIRRPLNDIHRVIRCKQLVPGHPTPGGKVFACPGVARNDLQLVARFQLSNTNTEFEDQRSTANLAGVPTVFQDNILRICTTVHLGSNVTSDYNGPTQNSEVNSLPAVASDA